MSDIEYIMISFFLSLKDVLNEMHVRIQKVFPGGRVRGIFSTIFLCVTVAFKLSGTGAPPFQDLPLDLHMKYHFMACQTLQYSIFSICII